MHQKIGFIGIICLLIHANAFGQLQLILNKNSSVGLSPTDCWNISISNPGQSESIYLIATISNQDGKKVCELRGNNVLLRQGISKFNPQNIETIKTNYSDADVQRAVVSTGYYPAGTYAICVAVISVDDDREIGYACREEIVSETNAAIATANKKSKFKNIDFYGNVSLEGVYSNNQLISQELPSSYARFDINPAISIYETPLIANVHLTTEQSPTYPDLNTYSLSFDRATFQKHLQEILIKKLTENQLKQSKLDEAVMKQVNELENLENLLQDPALQLELLALDTLQNAINTIQNDSKLGIEEKQAQLAKLQTQYNTLLAKKRQVERLLERKEQLLALKDQWMNKGILDEIKNRSNSIAQLNDPIELRNALSQYGLLAGTNQLFASVQELTIGTAYPIYSPLTLNGIQVNGGYFVWTPRNLFFSATSGKTQSTIINDSLPQLSQYNKKMFGAKIGWGQYYSKHLMFSAVVFNDFPNSFENVEGTTNYPTGVKLGSLDFQLGDSREKVIELGGEIAGMLFNHNLNDTSNLASLAVKNINLPNSLVPSLSTSFDYAWNSRMIINMFNLGTRFIASSRFVGPGYTNPGTPGLRNDVRSLEGRLEQTILKGKLRLIAEYRKEEDNFSGAKGISTMMNEISGEFSLRLKKLPQVHVRYMHSQQENNLFNYGSEIWNASASHSFEVLKRRNNININYLHFSNISDTSVSSTYFANYILLNHMIALSKTISASLNCQLAYTTVDGVLTNTQTFGIQASAYIFKSLSVGGGISRSNDIAINNKLSTQFQINYAITKHINFDFLGNYNSFSNLPYMTDAYNENYVRGRLLFNW